MDLVAAVTKPVIPGRKDDTNAHFSPSYLTEDFLSGTAVPQSLLLTWMMYIIEKVAITHWEGNNTHEHLLGEHERVTQILIGQMVCWAQTMYERGPRTVKLLSAPLREGN